MINVSKLIKPKSCLDLIRLGRKGDGGYIVSKLDLEKIDFILSFGLDADWSFEKDLSKITKKPVHIYDHSVNLFFFITHSIKCIIRFIQNPIKNYSKILGVFKIISYFHFFYLNNNIHHKMMIYPSTLKKDFFNNALIDINQILKNTFSNNIFLKIDIEGFEYRILDQILINQDKIQGLVIEFHNCDLFEDKIIKFIKNFKLHLVHIHVNNFSPPNINNFATAIELSFSSKCAKNKNDNFYPVESLDHPNNLMEIDQKVNFV